VRFVQILALLEAGWMVVWQKVSKGLRVVVMNWDSRWSA
jgi:hypothetical protein